MASVAVDMGCASIELSSSMFDLSIPAMSSCDESETSSTHGEDSPTCEDTPVPGFGDLMDYSRYETGGDVDPFCHNIHPAIVEMKKQQAEALSLQNMLGMPIGMPAMMQVNEVPQGQMSRRLSPSTESTTTSPFQTPMQQPMQQPVQNVSPVQSAQATQSVRYAAAGYDVMPSIYNQMNATPQMTGTQINGAQMMNGNQMHQMNGNNLVPGSQAARDYQILEDLLASGRVTIEMLANVANAQGVGLPHQRARKMNRPGKKNKSNEPREKVFIGGLDGDVTDDMLLEYFNGFKGEVREAAVLCDGATGLSRGFGFVTFANVVPEGVYGHVHTINGRRCGVRPYNYTPSN